MEAEQRTQTAAMTKVGKVGLVAVRTVRSSAGSTHNPSMLGKIRSGFLCSIITEQVQGDVLESEVGAEAPIQDVSREEILEKSSSTDHGIAKG